jgi:hypothetical protein
LWHQSCTSDEQEVTIMFRRLSTSFGMVLLASSFALAGQTTGAGTAKQTPVTTAKSQAGSVAKETPTKTKKHRKHHKSAAKQAPKQSSTTPQQ